MENTPPSSNARIKRSKGPQGRLAGHNCRRKALPHLLKDFEERCAYSMRHSLHAGGESQMEVDHFNPHLRGNRRHSYPNLYLAVAHCNNKKSDCWPTVAERRAGIRFLDPCRERDYGKHIFENPETHQLEATTPAGQYHIDTCDLNNPTFVDERSRRAAIRKCAKLVAFHPIDGDWDKIAVALKSVNEMIDTLIPDIDPPPEHRISTGASKATRAASPSTSSSRAERP